MWSEHAATTYSASGLILLYCLLILRLLKQESRGAYNPLRSILVACAVIFGASPVYRSLIDSQAIVPEVEARNPQVALWSALIFLAGLTFPFVVRRLFIGDSFAYDVEPSERLGCRKVDSTYVLAITSAVLVAGLCVLAYVAGLGGFSVLLAGRSQEVREAVVDVGPLSYAPLTVPGVASSIIVHSNANLRPRVWRLIVSACIFAAAVYLPLGTRRFLLICLLLPLAARIFCKPIKLQRSSVVLVSLIGLVVLSAIPQLRTAGAREQAGGWFPIFQEVASSPLETTDYILAGPDTAMPDTLAAQIEAVESANTFGLITLNEVVFFLVPGGDERLGAGVHDRILIDLYGKPCHTGRCEDSSVIGSFHYEGGNLGVLLGGLMMGFLIDRTFVHWVRTRTPFLTLVASSLFVFLPIMFRAGLNPALTWLLMALTPGIISLLIFSGNIRGGLVQRRTSNVSGRTRQLR